MRPLWTDPSWMKDKDYKGRDTSLELDLKGTCFRPNKDRRVSEQRIPPPHVKESPIKSYSFNPYVLGVKDE